MPRTDYWLATERLALRRFISADIDWLAALYGDPDVMHFLGGVRDRAKTHDVLHSRILPYYDHNPGLGVWMTVERASGSPIGIHSLNHILGEQIIHVGFTLVVSAWAKGYATEMALALLRHGFVGLGIPRICGMASLQNHASQRVLTRIGLIRNGERAFPHPHYASRGPMAWFERDAPAWVNEWVEPT